MWFNPIILAGIMNPIGELVISIVLATSEKTLNFKVVGVVR